jgi:hypothetical protein
METVLIIVFGKGVEIDEAQPRNGLNGSGALAASSFVCHRQPRTHEAYALMPQAAISRLEGSNHRLSTGEMVKRSNLSRIAVAASGAAFSKF